MQPDHLIVVCSRRRCLNDADGPILAAPPGDRLDDSRFCCGTRLHDEADTPALERSGSRSAASPRVTDDPGRRVLARHAARQERTRRDLQTLSLPPAEIYHAL